MTHGPMTHGPIGPWALDFWAHRPCALHLALGPLLGVPGPITSIPYYSPVWLAHLVLAHSAPVRGTVAGTRVADLSAGIVAAVEEM